MLERPDQATPKSATKERPYTVKVPAGRKRKGMLDFVCFSDNSDRKFEE